MDFLRDWILTFLIFLPAIGGGVVLLQRDRESVRRIATTFAVLAFIISLSLLLPGMFDWSKGGGYDYTTTGHGAVQLVLQADWIPAFNIHYKVGIDGLSLPLIVLSTFIFALACVASWDVTKMPRGYFALLLFLETGILGTFLSLDLFLFYVFFEVSLLPMYFLIGIWGGPRKEYAAIKFFLYTLVGSIALLVALIGTHLYTGSFDLIALPMLLKAKMGPAAGQLTPAAAKAFFLLLMFGFFVKVPAVPLHTWLPDAHVEAPTPISMILAAVLLKMGGYGILRIAYPLYPGAGKAVWMLVAVVGVVSILYGALCAMAQTDFKRLVAYSSVSHMGFVMLGAGMMTPGGMNGAVFMMVAHGVTSAALFFLVGVLYDRTGHRELSRFGGLATTMPGFAGFSAVAMFANLGLPGLCGFVGEVMVLIGSFQAARNDSVLRSSGHAGTTAIYVLSALACFGVVLTAGYMLWTIQRIFFGSVKSEYRSLPDVTGRETLVLTPLTMVAILLGVLPTVFVFAFTDRTVAAISELFR